MKTTIYYIIEILSYQLDLFKTSFTFYYSGGKKQRSSIIGTVFSLFIFAILLNYFIQSDMIQRVNPSVISQNIPQRNRPEIKLNHRNFELVFGMYDKNLSFFKIEDNIYKVETFMEFYLLEEQEGKMRKKKIIQPLTYHRCNFSDFPSDSSFNLTGLELAYCLDNLTLNIFGYETEANGTLFTIQVLLCDDSLQNNSCQNKSDIDKFLQDKSFGVYYIDYNLDIQNYDNPIFSTDRNFFKFEQIFLKKAEFLDDKIIYGFFGEPDKKEFFEHDYETKDLQIRTIDNRSIPIFEIDFCSSENLEQSQRIYQKLPNLLANLAGIYNILVIIGMIILNLKQEMCLILYIINKLYDFQNINQPHKDQNNVDMGPIISDSLKKEKLNIIINQLDLTNQPILNPEKNLQNRTLPQFEYISPKNLEDSMKSISQEKNSQKHEKVFIKTKKFNINFLEFLKFKFQKFFHRKLTDKEKLIKKTEKEFYSKLDIKQILRKIQEIDIIKYILFTQKENLALKMIKKPQIYLKKSIKNDNYNTKFKLFNQIKYQVKRKDVENLKKMFKNSSNKDVKQEIIELLDWEKFL